MHLAGYRRNAFPWPPVGYRPVSHFVMPARVRGKLSGHRAGGNLYEPVLRGIALQNIPVGEILLAVDGFHERAPKLCRGTSARGF